MSEERDARNLDPRPVGAGGRCHEERHHIVPTPGKIRAESQTFDLTLLEYMTEVGFENLEGFRSKFCQALLGSNFSLWRFAFLLYEDREPVSIFEAMKYFISKLAEDNTMLFQRELETQAWLSGYYWNNSKFRIHILMDLIEDEYGPSAVNSIEDARIFRKTIEPFYGANRDKTIGRKESFEGLTTLFEMQKRLFEFLKEKDN